MRYVHRLTGPLLAATLVASCAAIPSREEAAAPAAPVQEPAAPERTSPEASPVASAVVPTPARIGFPHTAVVVSADIPEYTQIAAEILRRGGNVTVYGLSAQPSNATNVVAALENARPDRIIAVGLLAAVVARGVADTPMVFCQVYNYQDHPLISAKSKGVDLLPPVDLQLRAWQALGRNLRRVGVVTGPGHDPLLAEMRHAAASVGIELTAKVVQSDREALHEFRELAPYVDGLWLLPDNRILSPDVVREIFSYSAKHAKQIAVFGENLLAMGALLSSTADPRDVVDRVLERLDAVDDSGRILGPDMLPLTAIHTRVNDEVARRMGLVSSVERAAAAR
jgi:hypothetical protein